MEHSILILTSIIIQPKKKEAAWKVSGDTCILVKTFCDINAKAGCTADTNY